MKAFNLIGYGIIITVFACIAIAATVGVLTVREQADSIDPVEDAIEIASKKEKQVASVTEAKPCSACEENSKLIAALQKRVIELQEQQELPTQIHALTGWNESRRKAVTSKLQTIRIYLQEAYKDLPADAADARHEIAYSYRKQLGITRAERMELREKLKEEILRYKFSIENWKREDPLSCKLFGILVSPEEAKQLYSEYKK